MRARTTRTPGMASRVRRLPLHVADERDGVQPDRHDAAHAHREGRDGRAVGDGVADGRPRRRPSGQHPRVSRRILVVDDDGPVRRTLARTLGAEGYETGAADGGAALAEIERDPPDAIVLDAVMPGVDGLAVARRLRAKGLAVPILMLTARDGVSDRVAGLDAGADDYLVKPFATEELLARVRALCGGGRGPGARVRRHLARRGARIVVRGGRTIELTQREAELLELLLRRPGKVLSRRTAMTTVWSDGRRARERGRPRRRLSAPQARRPSRHPHRPRHRLRAAAVTGAWAPAHRACAPAWSPPQRSRSWPRWSARCGRAGAPGPPPARRARRDPARPRRPGRAAGRHGAGAAHLARRCSTGVGGAAPARRRGGRSPRPHPGALAGARRPTLHAGSLVAAAIHHGRSGYGDASLGGRTCGSSSHHWRRGRPGVGRRRDRRLDQRRDRLDAAGVAHADHRLGARRSAARGADRVALTGRALRPLAALAAGAEVIERRGDPSLRLPAGGGATRWPG